MTTIVVASAPDLFISDHRLWDLTRRLVDTGEPVVVVSSTPAPERPLDGASAFDVPARWSLLERWLHGWSQGGVPQDDVWFVDAACPPEAGALESLRRGSARADGVFGSGHALVRSTALAGTADAWRSRDPVFGGCLEQLWDALRAEGYLPLPVEDATPRIVPPFADAPGGPVRSDIEQGKNAEVTIGRHTYAHPPGRIIAYEDTAVCIGAFCSIAPEVLLCNPAGTGVRLRTEDGRPLPARLTRFAAGHHPETAALYPLSGTIRPDPGCYITPGPGSQLAKPLVVGNDVWIGAAAKIVGGFTIGHGAIISSGAVVLGDVPPFAVVVGNPATVVRYRFSPAVIEQLLRIRWWDWPDEVIVSRASWFQKPIAEFVARFGPEAEDAAPDLVPPARTSGEQTSA